MAGGCLCRLLLLSLKSELDYDDTRHGIEIAASDIKTVLPKMARSGRGVVMS